MNQLNIDLVKNSQCTLNELFDLYKEVFPTNQQWAEILTAREGILNFSSLKSILKKLQNILEIIGMENIKQVKLMKNMKKMLSMIIKIWEKNVQ